MCYQWLKCVTIQEMVIEITIVSESNMLNLWLTKRLLVTLYFVYILTQYKLRNVIQCTRNVS